MRKAETLIASQNALGEGPVWDDQRKKIFWVDILGKKVHRAAEDGSEHEVFDTPDYVSNIFLTRQGEELILCLPDAFYLWNPENERLKKWLEMPHYDSAIRTNDGFCDPHGNLWIGTMALSEKPNLGNLYMLDTHMNWHTMLPRTSISNGIRCCPEGRDFYYIDTPTQLIRKFRFDPDHQTWEFVRNVAYISPEDGHPDGMSMDENGDLWISLWNGYGIIRLNTETGEFTKEVEVAAPQVSANIFGGEDGNQLFITTARKLLAENTLAKYPETGNLFTVRTEVRGSETFRRKL